MIYSFFLILSVQQPQILHKTPSPHAHRRPLPLHYTHLTPPPPPTTHNLPSTPEKKKRTTPDHQTPITQTPQPKNIIYSFSLFLSIQEPQSPSPLHTTTTTGYP